MEAGDQLQAPVISPPENVERQCGRGNIFWTRNSRKCNI